MLTSTDRFTMALDRVRFAQAACPGYTFDPWQEQLLRSQHPRILANVHRQGGKSLVCALISLHTALYQPGSLVLMVSPSLRQSALLYQTTLSLYRTLGKPVAPEIENRLSLELENNSKIVSLPGQESTIRGYAGARLVVIDEASRVPDSMLAAIRPFLAVSNGRLIAPSTGAGRRGWWYQEWTEGGDTWERYQVKATECKRISAEFLAEERRVLGVSWYMSEYECEFTSDENAVFPEHYLARIISDQEHAWSVPLADWAGEPMVTPPTKAAPSESWSNDIKIQRDPRMTPYGVPWP